MREIDSTGDDETPLTRAQLMRLYSAVKVLGLDEEDETLNLYTQAIYSAAEELVESGFEGAKKLLDVETGFDIVPAWTLAQMEGYAKQLGFLVVEREKHGLSQLIELAIANGDGARELAKDINAYFSEGYHVLDENGEVTRRMPTSSWSMTVARTELSRASNLGAMAQYRSAGIKKIEWSAADSETTCQECHDADGEIVKIGEDFPFVDVPHPPAHPRCCCGIIPADEIFGDFIISPEDRARAKRGGYSAEEYERKFGRKHPIDVRTKRKKES